MIYKIRLLYVNPVTTSPRKSQLCLYLKPKGAPSQSFQRYPVKGYITLEANEPYIPEVPIIVFAHLKTNTEKEVVTIEVRNTHNELVTQQDFLFALGTEKNVVDHFNLDTGLDYTFQFAVYSYTLQYTLDDEYLAV